jgi:hypothetical protein
MRGAFFRLSHRGTLHPSSALRRPEYLLTRARPRRNLFRDDHHRRRFQFRRIRRVPLREEERRTAEAVSAIALMAYGYFVSNAWLSFSIGAVLTLLLFFPR